jgi:nitrogen fixation NifU-like protein
MSDPRELYQALILEHGNHPRRERKLDGTTNEARRTNPLCGDRITLSLRVDGGVIRAVGFEARGCLIARASASILGDIVEGRTAAEARVFARALHALARDAEPPADAGPLEPLRPVRAFPARIACVELAWSCLDEALGAEP